MIAAMALLGALAAASPAATITVDTAKRFQTMEGFGAAITESTAVILEERVPAAQRDRLLRSLFDPKSGAGFSFIRLPIGSCDFRTREYTFDDMPTGDADPQMTHFSIAPDLRVIVPLIRRIRRINPAVRIMASPWSPPAWMKTSGRLNGGELRDDPAIHAAFARYLVRFIQAYRRLGIPIQFLSLQNEPGWQTADYPSMAMSAATQAKLVVRVDEALRAARLSTRLLIWDHNWDHPEYPLAILADPAARAATYGVAWHAYGGEPTAQTKVHDLHPDKPAFFTEISGGDWATDFGGNLMWDMTNLIVGATRNWAACVLKWNLALDEGHGPKIRGGGDDCRGVITVDSRTGVVTLEEDYYALAHAARFVRPGALRVASDHEQSVAFLNPDRSVVVIVFNPDPAPRRVTLTIDEASFAHTLPPVSAVTFRLRPRAALEAWITSAGGLRLAPPGAGGG